MLTMFIKSYCVNDVVNIKLTSPINVKFDPEKMDTGKLLNVGLGKVPTFNF